MSQDKNEFDFLDPTGMFKTMRNDTMDAWAKFMVELVNTDAYADAMGKMIDAWLSNSTPFRKVIEKTMTQSLANLSMPSREDVTRLAERLTNIEMRLDDLDAKLDELPRATRPAPSGKKTRSSGSENQR